jgi:hypothetical protein
MAYYLLQIVGIGDSVFWGTMNISHLRIVPLKDMRLRHLSLLPTDSRQGH